MAQGRKSSIKLNNREYFIRPGSYRREIAPTTIPKFSTGDIGYSDLTAWQFWAQSDWSEGGYRKFSVTGREYAFGRGLDTFSRAGKIAMLPDICAITSGSGVTANFSPTDMNAYDGEVFAAEQSGISAYFHKITSSAYKWHKVFTYTSAHVSAKTSYLKRSVYTPHGLFYAAGQRFIKFANTTPTKVALTNVYDTIRGKPVYFNNAVFAYVVNQSANTASLVSVDPVSGTITTQATNLPLVTTDTQVSMEVLDGKIFIFLSLSGKVLRFTFDGVTLAEVNFLNGILYATATWNGNIYLLLADYLYQTVPNKKIIRINAYEVKTIYDSLESDFSVDSFNLHSTPYGVLVDNVNNLDEPPLYSNVAYLIREDDTFHAFLSQKIAYFSGSLSPTQVKYFVPGASNTANRRWFLGSNTAGQTGYLSFEGGHYLQNSYPPMLQSSIIDFDLFNVDKYFGGITVYHTPLPTDTQINVSVKIDRASSWTLVGSNSTSGSVSFDIQLLSGNIGKKIEYKIDFVSPDGASSTPTEPAVVEDVVIRYILQPKTKRKWAFDLLLANNIEEYGVKRSAGDLDKELWAIIQGGVQKFTDVDGKVYDASKSGTLDRGVLVTDCKEVGPYPFGDDGPEFIAQVELQEG